MVECGDADDVLSGIENVSIQMIQKLFCVIFVWELISYLKMSTFVIIKFFIFTCWDKAFNHTVWPNSEWSMTVFVDMD